MSSGPKIRKGVQVGLLVAKGKWKWFWLDLLIRAHIIFGAFERISLGPSALGERRSENKTESGSLAVMIISFRNCENVNCAGSKLSVETEGNEEMRQRSHFDVSGILETWKFLSFVERLNC